MSRRSTGTSRNPDAHSGSRRRLIVSFHDLHPGSRECAERCLRLLAEHGIDRVSLLVVPRWHGGPSCTEDRSFTAWLGELAAAGHEICLHGFTHRAASVRGGPLARLIGRRYTQGEGEFFQLSTAEAAQRVRTGIDLLAGVAGLPVFGFTPPAWLLSPAALVALRAAGLHYTTTWGAVHLLQTGDTLPAPTLVYSCRNAWRRRVSRIWVHAWHATHRRAPILRLAIHPGDFADPRLVESLRHHACRAIADGRAVATYSDLLPAGTAPLQPSAGVAA